MLNIKSVLAIKSDEVINILHVIDFVVFPAFHTDTSNVACFIGAEDCVYFIKCVQLHIAQLYSVMCLIHTNAQTFF